MMEPGGTPIPLTTLSGGINRLKVRGSVSPSRLYDLVNARLTIEGTVVPREGTIRAAQLTSLTAGLVYYNGKFNVFSTTAQTVPTGYVDNILVGPNGPTDLISFIWFAKPFLGFLYVVAEFVSGAIAHFWLQSSGTWTKNTVYQVGAIVTPTTPNGLAYLATRDLLPNPTWAPDTLVTVDELVEPTVPNGYYFKATTVDGTNPHTGLTEPTWPASIGATVQEFGDYPTVTAAAPVGSTLAAGITDRYGDSADIAGIAPASTTGAVTTLPPIGLTLAPWRAGKIYPAGSIVTPTATQGAVINAIPNGDFEAGNDGNWIFTGPGQQWSISNAGVPYQGSYEAINPPGTTSALMTMNTFGVCTPGQTIKVSYYLTTGTSTGSNIQVSAKMNWYSDTGATALISTTDGGAHASQSGWTQEISTFVAPAGAITCRVAIHAASVLARATPRAWTSLRGISNRRLRPATSFLKRCNPVPVLPVQHSQLGLRWTATQS